MFKIHVVVRIAVCFLFVFLPLQSMDEWFYDRFFRVRGRQDNSTPIVLIRVNNTTLAQARDEENQYYPRMEPEPRSRTHTLWHHKLYEKLLSAIEKENPKLVIFTSFFDGVDDDKAPRVKHPNVLFSAYLDEENKLIPPTAHLTDGENYGFSNIFPDSDNIVRKTHLIYSSGSSLAVRAYQRLKDLAIPRDLMSALYIDYKGPSGSFETYEAREFLDANGDLPDLKGKIVMIGREGSRFSEYETPFGPMSKLEIQANILENFLEGSEIRILPRIVTLVLATLAVVTSVAIILYFPLTMAWIFLILQSVFILFAALLTFSFGKYWAGVANPIFCIFGTHLLLLGYKLSRQEEEQWRIQQEAEYLKSVDQFKNNFISLFSHDLKTPIAKIKAITGRLLSEHPELAPEVTKSLKTLDQTNNELARLISDILKVTKMESMQLQPAKEVIDLNRLVEEAIHRLQFLADEKNIQLVQDLEPLFSMEGDLNLIQEVITNLIENAIKYSPPNRRVVVRTNEEEGRVHVSVIDEGVGIPADELPRVTSKFYRGKSVSQTTKGSGLGLYLSKYFVELHQGSLEIQSELGKGTRVSFWLPITA